MTRRRYGTLILTISLLHLSVCAWLILSANIQHTPPHPYSGLIFLTVTLNTLLQKQPNPSLTLLFTALLSLLGLGGHGLDALTCALCTLAACAVMTGLLMLAPKSEA